MHVLLSAAGKNDFAFVARLPPECKVVCVANAVSEALKAARIPIERVRPLTADAMGDWRQVHTLRRMFEDAGVDSSAASEEDFALALEQMTRDRTLEALPSLRVHQLFSGNVRDLEDYADPCVLAWGDSRTSA